MSSDAATERYDDADAMERAEARIAKLEARLAGVREEEEARADERDAAIARAEAAEATAAEKDQEVMRIVNRVCEVLGLCAPHANHATAMAIISDVRCLACDRAELASLRAERERDAAVVAAAESLIDSRVWVNDQRQVHPALFDALVEAVRQRREAGKESKL